MMFKKVKKILTCLFLTNFSIISAIKLQPVTVKPSDHKVLCKLANDYTYSRVYESVLGELDRMVVSEYINKKENFKDLSALRSRCISNVLKMVQKSEREKLYEPLLRTFDNNINERPNIIIKELYTTLKPYLTKDGKKIYQAIESNLDTFNKEIQKNQRIYAIKNDEDKTVGGAVLSLDDGSKMYLHHIWINQSEGNKGYGSEAMHEIIRIAKDELKAVSITLEAERSSLVGFYEKFGFKQSNESDPKQMTLEL